MGREPIVMDMVHPLEFKFSDIKLQLITKPFSRWMRYAGLDRLQEKEFISSVEVETLTFLSSSK
jgi:hypothetical protein